jgi:hypothetical protein
MKYIIFSNKCQVANFQLPYTLQQGNSQKTSRLKNDAPWFTAREHFDVGGIYFLGFLPGNQEPIDWLIFLTGWT